MNTFTRSVSQIFRGAGKTFRTYPAAIACAMAFSIVTMVRIQIDWPEQQNYNYLLSCLHWSFAVGVVFSLATITAAQSRFDKHRAFVVANLIGGAAVIVTFLALYLPGGAAVIQPDLRAATVSGLVAFRAGMAMLVSLFAFILLAGYPEDRFGFAHSFFMTHKAFFIALIYGVVIMGGCSGVAGSVQGLLYRDMSEKVYMYLGTLTGFLAFTIFVGYFPSFRKGYLDERRETTQKQPRFIEVLFGYIMVPIMLALTVVLLIWAGKIVVTRSWPDFQMLSGIAAAYTVGGIWLHIMVTHHRTGLANFYRRIYPIAALIILAFEAWALMIQLGNSGLKVTEYVFILVWIFAAAAAILLLILKDRAHPPIAILICVLAVFSVLPVVGYHALPVTVQTTRLENLLISQGILQDGGLVPTTSEPERGVRVAITDAVEYLAYAQDAKLPTWFNSDLARAEVFKAELGFEQAWPEQAETGGGTKYIGTSLVLPFGAVDISDYRWAVSMQNYYGKDGDSVTIDGEKGTYTVNWITDTADGIPSLRITLGGSVILEQDLSGFIDQIAAKFPPGQDKVSPESFDDMCLRLETPEIDVLLVFNNIDINVNPTDDTISYWLNLGVLYMNEKR